MADEDNAEEVEAPEEEPQPDTEEAAMLHFGRYSEMRHAVPWQQKSMMEKASYYMDRFFIVFFVVFLIVVMGEFSYKMWYVTNVQKIKEFVSDLVSWLFTYVSDLVSRLFTHEKEKKIEL